MSKLKDKLFNHEVIPPNNNWEKIAAALDEAPISLRKAAELESAEVQPPAFVWDNISAALDTTPNEGYAGRLYQLEVQPPSATWKNIVKSLDETIEQPAPVSRTRVIPFFRYAAAAAIIGILAFVIVRLTPGGTAGDEHTIASTPDTKTPANAASAGSAMQTGSSVDRGSRNASLLSSVSISAGAKQQRMKSNPPSRPRVHENQSDALYAYEDHIPDVSDRYIMLLTPEGNLIRMSKKLSNLVCCVSGEEQDADCKSQIRKWQEQLAASPVSPAPGNFMDILNMVNTLNEDNGL